MSKAPDPFFPLPGQVAVAKDESVCNFQGLVEFVWLEESRGAQRIVDSERKN